jgi:hypothetical protein
VEAVLRWLPLGRRVVLWLLLVVTISLTLTAGAEPPARKKAKKATSVRQVETYAFRLEVVSQSFFVLESSLLPLVKEELRLKQNQLDQLAKLRSIFEPKLQKFNEIAKNWGGDSLEAAEKRELLREGRSQIRDEYYAQREKILDKNQKGIQRLLNRILWQMRGFMAMAFSDEVMDVVSVGMTPEMIHDLKSAVKIAYGKAKIEFGKANLRVLDENKKLPPNETPEEKAIRVKRQIVFLHRMDHQAYADAEKLLKVNGPLTFAVALWEFNKQAGSPYDFSKINLASTPSAVRSPETVKGFPTAR